MMVLGGMWMINSYVGTIMLGSLGSAKDTGIFTVVSKGADLVTIGLVAVTTPLSPRIARLYAAGDLPTLRRVTVHGARLCMAWAVPAALALFLLRHVFLGLFGGAFTGAGTPLAIMLVGQLANAVAGPAGVVLMMTKHERAAAVGVGLGCLLNVALNAVLVPTLGVNGAAIGTAASIVLWNAALAGYAAMQMGVNTTAFPFPRWS
jgi:O-antigen/teichoic acid export membrane protein